MRKLYYLLLTTLLLVCGQPNQLKAQIFLHLVDQGIVGFPDTVQYGDTVKNLAVKVTNNGILPLTTLLISVDAFFQNTGATQTLGILSLPLNLLNPGDTVLIPLSPFVVTPQNSSQGANIMVIWPDSPGTPRDSTTEDYWVGPAATSIASAEGLTGIRIYPQPTKNYILFDRGSIIRTQSVSLHVHDLQGQLIHFSEHLPSRLSVEGWPPGLYLLRFESTEGGVSTRKILVR